MHWEKEVILSTLAWFHFPSVQLSLDENEMFVCLSVCVFVFAVLDRSLVASCKDSIGWMFSKLDTNGDLYLDQAELAAINLDKYEVCIRPFFNSCDSYRDGKVSTAEWCLCFWRESEYSGAVGRFKDCLCVSVSGACVLAYSPCIQTSRR